MIIPLWLLPYLLLLGGGGWLGEAIHVPALGWTLGIAATIAYGIWRKRARAAQFYQAEAQRQWLAEELAELDARRSAEQAEG